MDTADTNSQALAGSIVVEDIPSHSRFQKQRHQRLFYAWVSLLPSKGVTFIVQAIALPTVYRAIGPAQFAAYAVVTSAMVIFNFLNLGLGGALVTPLAHASALGNKERESALLSSTFLPILAVTGVMLLVGIPILLAMPMKTLFGVAAATTSAPEMRAAALFAFVGTLASIPFSVIDSARQAYQEMHISNVFGMVSNGVLCIGLLMVAWKLPTLPAFVAVMCLLPLTVRAANGISLILRRPYLLPWRSRFISWELTRSLAKDGLSYVGAAALANFLVYEWPVYYIARVRPSLESSRFAVYLRLILLVMSFGFSLLQPLWPAVADAKARADKGWLFKAVHRARLAAIAYGLITLIGFGLGMNTLLKLWLHRALDISALECWLAGAYLLLVTWEYMHWPIVLGLGKMRAASNVIFARAVAFALFVPLAVHHGQAWVMVALCASIIFSTAWYYPRLLARTLGRLKVSELCPSPSGLETN